MTSSIVFKDSTSIFANRHGGVRGAIIIVIAHRRTTGTYSGQRTSSWTCVALRWQWILVLWISHHAVTGLSVGMAVTAGRDTRPVAEAVRSKKKQNRVVLRQRRRDYAACVKMSVKQCVVGKLTPTIESRPSSVSLIFFFFCHMVRRVRLTSIARASLPFVRNW